MKPKELKAGYIQRNQKEERTTEILKDCGDYLDFCHKPGVPANSITEKPSTEILHPPE